MGKALMDYLSEFAKEKGCDYLKLECAPDKIGFYEKSGFKTSESLSMRKPL